MLEYFLFASHKNTIMSRSGKIGLGLSQGPHRIRTIIIDDKPEARTPVSEVELPKPPVFQPAPTVAAVATVPATSHPATRKKLVLTVKVRSPALKKMLLKGGAVPVPVKK